LLAPNSTVSAVVSLMGPLGQSAQGIAKSRITGLLKDVVSIKKVINKKPKSTIGVMSILVESF
jgi:hypothetical protein